MPNDQTAKQTSEVQLSGNTDNTPASTDEPKPPLGEGGVVVPIEKPQQQRGEVIDPPR